LATLSLVVGKNKDTTPIYATIKAWRSLAHVAAKALKGDSVFAIGTLNVREYQGKEYKELNCEWLNVASASKVSYVPTSDMPNTESNNSGFKEVEDAESELPF
jgi:single-stranded DNA-binding protein